MIIDKRNHEEVYVITMLQVLVVDGKKLRKLRLHQPCQEQ